MGDVARSDVRAAGAMLQIQPQHTARREFGTESVVLDLHRSVYYGLNRTAGVLWDRLLSGVTRAELVSFLIADGAPVDHVEQDVDDFLLALRQAGLVHDVDA